MIMKMIHKIFQGFLTNEIFKKNTVIFEIFHLKYFSAAPLFLGSRPRWGAYDAPSDL